jgi:hypothetical protein
MTEQRCGTCRFYATAPMDKDRSSFCLFTIAEPVPFWIASALEQATDFVEPNDGAYCETWEPKS